MDSKKKTLTETEEYVWQYLNSNFQTISDISISELSETLSVSNATITRTLQKKGYSGFSDFKYNMLTRNRETLTVLQQETISDETRMSILKSYQEVTRTLNMLDLNTLNQAVNNISSANRIVIFARGFSELLASEIQTKLQLLEKYCELHTDPNIIRPVSRRLSQGDFVIFVSLNGETRALQDAALNCQQQNVPTLLISANSSGSLGKMTDLQLFAFKTELTYFPDFEVHSRLPLYIIARLLLDTYAAHIKNSE